MGTPQLSVTHEVPRDCTARVTKNFLYREFDCHCDNSDCTWTLVSGDLAVRLQALRDRIGQPIIIRSAYRCQKRQRWLATQTDNQGKPLYQTAKGISTHETGDAADIEVLGLPAPALAEHAKAVGFRAIGVAKKWIHVDTREQDIHWEYST